MSKLNIDFILLDESIVRNGFRAIMSGAQLDEFKRNPVMLFMHSRAKESAFSQLDDSVVLPIGKWYDIRIDSGKLLAKPEFDDDDEFANRIEQKVKKSYLNAASVWIDPITVSDDKALMLPGQAGPTITKWGVLEASIVDIPNCKGALAIRNEKGEKLKLFGDKNENVLNYLKTLVPAQNPTYNLRVYHLIDDAINKGKLAYNDRQKYLQLATVNYETTKELLDRLPHHEEEALSKNVELQELLKLSGRELYLQGEMERLKVLSPSHFRLKFKEYYGKEYPYSDVKANPGLEMQLSGSKSLNSELIELLKLSGRELYLQGKLQRLKEISPENYKLKHKDYFGIEPSLN